MGDSCWYEYITQKDRRNVPNIPPRDEKLDEFHEIIPLQVGNTDAQYNAARVLRHLAMSGGALAKSSALPAVPALLLGLKVQPPAC